MTECLYCGNSKRQPGPVNVCICGRSGSWPSEYEPRLLGVGPYFDEPKLLKIARRVKYTLYPVNAPIIADAIARHAAKQPA